MLHNTHCEVTIRNQTPASVTRVALLTGGFDHPYAFGLSTALAGKGAQVDIIGSDTVDSPDYHRTPGITFFNLQRGWSPHVSRTRKVIRTALYYIKLLHYVYTKSPPLLHILWNNRDRHFDRTILLVIYRLLGKRLLLTAHNINTARRNGNDGWLNRLTLRVQYHLMDGIFIHTAKMADELRKDYGVSDKRIHQVSFGINNAVPSTNLTPGEAKQRLRCQAGERVVLFFGRIEPYKGLEHLVGALEILERRTAGLYKLLIAGEPKKEHLTYWADIRSRILNGPLRHRTHMRAEFIPDVDTELYCKAADVLVLPYKDIYQSGVLFLAYSFGLPVIATAVGSFPEYVIAGKTGLICATPDPQELARSLEMYFEGALYAKLAITRREIQDFARERYSWASVASDTLRTYEEVLHGN